MAAKMNFKFRRKQQPKELKTQWPELVGMDAEEATTIIDKEHPGLRIQIIPKNRVVTKVPDANCVRIYVDSDQRVTLVPHIG